MAQKPLRPNPDEVERIILSSPYKIPAEVEREWAIKPTFKRLAHTAQALMNVLGSGKGKRILDIGIYAPVASLWEFLDFEEIYGISKEEWAAASREHQRRAAERGKIFRLFFLDVERKPLPFEDRFFDVVALLEVIEHFSVHPWHALSEVNRVTKAGGLLVLSCPNAVSARILAGLLAGRNSYSDAYNGVDSNRHNRLYSAEEVEEVLKCARFEPLVVKTVNIYPSSVAWNIFSRGLEVLDFLSSLVRAKRGTWS